MLPPLIIRNHTSVENSNDVKSPIPSLRDGAFSLSQFTSRFLVDKIYKFKIQLD